ncbi:P-loop containing nucleoside triphosphate hydrolase protein, partial [Mycena albidolilacea]
PPSSRTFVGRQNILRMMHDYFVRGADTNQEIFLLHGLGGSGKTQIALKFIQQSTLFSEVFLIDSTTLDTIESGLKDIAASRNIGEASQVTLQWLRCKHGNWLLFFDNADDPRIDLNSYFPLCNHGNILITSRNPGLQVYAGADCPVSDMEESESAELLLKIAAKEDTAKNRRIARDIMKVG